MAQSMEDVLDTLENAANDGDTVSADDMMSAFGRRAYGPLVFAVGLVMLSPINWIPGAGILLATVLILLVIQSLVRTGPPWVPARLRHARVESDRARRAIGAVRPWVRRAAAVVRPRLEAMTAAPWRPLAMVVIVVMALSMYPLAVIPGGTAPPSLVITLFGVALTVEDGVLMLVSLILSAAVVGFTAWVIL
ncbi:exopolysaccharide biosynthesis protein [Roseospira visakhapatnamensis]|uniref:Exopolysaccharide synthesis, ExoD n=1 Tax=Roseospira visakhapatnamensis TaxID=390880 RepID=A0A7W6RDF9_9PROT|nr:exopolysaccharide biosynthesis protein [Roseospira visakhapatnamensis]MBB4265873.1 hypothetical protein [Roseospira visakhapatnamensis]